MDYGIILAAGKGTRMHQDIPKCFIPVLGKPMINYLLDMLTEIKIDHIIGVFGKNQAVDDLKHKIDVAIQNEPLGTADAVKTALQHVHNEDGDLLILPGDAPFLSAQTAAQMLSYHKQNKNNLTIATIRVSFPKGYGRVIRDKKRIVKIVEEKDATEEEKKIQEVYCGMMCIRTSFAKKYIHQIQNNNAQKEYYLTDIIELISKTSFVDGFEIEDVFEGQGINDLFALSERERDLQKRIIMHHMEQGVRFENPSTIIIGPDVEFTGTAYVRTGSILLGKCVIGNKTIIGPYTEIEDSAIDDGCVIKQSVVHQSIVQKDTTIGPYAHLRNHSNIGQRNRIGNFVELKNTRTGILTYASHLAYIGDTECGSGVNFGCGIVTVNYDGKNKYKTKIGNNVFIGCNTNLIAPIEIADCSYIAAGSTITDSLEEDDFAIARAKQVTKEKYANKFHYKRVDEN